MGKLTADQTALAEAAFAKRMLGPDPATFKELIATGDRALGSELVGYGESSCYRLADRWLQKQRKAGNIAFVRIGRRTLWSPTPLGRTALGSGEARDGE